MDTSKAKPIPTTPSLHSRTSSVTLTKPDPGQSQQNEDGKHEAGPARYLYQERKGPGNPDAQPKRKSKLNKFLSKFQSPAVKQTNAARERELLEQERTGVKTYTPMGAPGSTNQATAAFM